MVRRARSWVRKSPVGRGAARLYSYVGWLDDHLGRIALILAIFFALVAFVAFVGGLVSDWPGYALYMSIMLTLGLGAIAVMVAVLVGRGQVVVNVAETASNTAQMEEIASPAITTDCAGLHWKMLKVNADVRALDMCPQHTDTRLLRMSDGKGARLIPLQDRSGDCRALMWSLLCSADDSHMVRLNDSETFIDSDFFAVRRMAIERLRAQASPQ